MRPLVWLRLMAVTAALLLLFTAIGLPAAALLAAITAGVAAGGGLKLPRWAFLAAQSAVGCMIGQTLTPDLLQEFMSHWALVLIVISSTVSISCGLGWVLHAGGLMDKASALWGTLPGAASAMLTLSAEHGANVGIVAFLQYFRVLSVALLAALAGGALSPATDAAIAATALGPPSWGAVSCVTIIAGLTLVASRLRVVGLSLIGAMVLAGGVQISGLAQIWLPGWLLTFAYCFIGWQVGLSLTKQTLLAMRRLVLPVALNTAMLLLACAGIALLMTRLFSVDLHTAFLATIPGGLDSVAVIAAATGADVAFVMLFQTVRFLIVVVIGIPLLGHILRLRQRSP